MSAGKTMRVRVRRDDLAVVDALAWRCGMTRGEYASRRILGLPCMPLVPPEASPGAQAGGPAAVRRRAPMRGGTRRDRQVWLPMTDAAASVLRDEASRCGESLAEHIVSHSCDLVTYDGRSALADEEGADVVCELSDIALATRRLEEFASALPERADEFISRARTIEALARSIDLGEGLLRGRFADARGNGEGIVRSHRGGIREPGLEGGGAVDKRGGVPADDPARPAGVHEKKGINVRVTGLEAHAMRECAHAVGLSLGDWVLVSCTPLGCGWSPLDVASLRAAEARLTAISNGIARSVSIAESVGAHCDAGTRRLLRDSVEELADVRQGAVTARRAVRSALRQGARLRG